MGGSGANGGIGVGINGAGTRTHGAPPNLRLTRLPVPSGTGWGSPSPPLTLDRPVARTRFRRRFAACGSRGGGSNRARDPPTHAGIRHCIASLEGTTI